MTTTTPTPTGGPGPTQMRREIQEQPEALRRTLAAHRALVIHQCQVNAPLIGVNITQECGRFRIAGIGFHHTFADGNGFLRAAIFKIKIGGVENHSQQTSAGIGGTGDSIVGRGTGRGARTRTARRGIAATIS